MCYYYCCHLDIDIMFSYVSLYTAEKIVRFNSSGVCNPVFCIANVLAVVQKTLKGF